MQIYVGGSGNSTTPADILTKRGDRLLENGAIGKAIAAYAQALAENPNHTHALVNLAAAYAQMNDPAKAYHAAAQARSIEPNYPLYHRACIQYLATQGLGRLALDDFHAAHECFPNVFDFDDIGAQLLVVCGYPEEALKCAEGCLLNPAEKGTLLEKVHAAVNAQATARPLIDEARSLVNQTKPHRVADLLSRAREIDPNDPLLAMNLGLTFAREGRSADSIPLLLYAANYVSPEWTKTCYANAAFCAMDEGNLDLAMILLDGTMARFDVELHGRQLQNLAADLPGRGNRVDDESIMEERVDSAARLVVRSVAEHKKHAIVSQNALRLATLYEEVADQ